MHSGGMFFAFNGGGFGPESGHDAFGEGFGETDTTENPEEETDPEKDPEDEEDVEDVFPDTGDKYDDGDWDSF